MQNVVGLGNDFAAVATHGWSAVVFATVVGLNVALEAVVFLTGLARLALVAAVDKGSDAGAVADLELGYVAANLNNVAGNLVAWNHRKNAVKPLITNLVDVAVANARECNFDANVVWANRAAFNVLFREFSSGSFCDQCASSSHVFRLTGGG